MKANHISSAALALAALAIGPAFAAGRASQQDDPFEKLKTYDFQARQPVEAIRLMIDRALEDKAATAQIEMKLDAVLSDPGASFAGKQEAARFLWIIGTARSVPVLSKLLVDEKLSDVARYALERDPDPAAGKALVAALPAVQGKILVGIINSIGARGEADAAPALKRYASDSDPLIAEAATVALGKIGTPVAVTILKALPADSIPAGVALRRAAEKHAITGKKADAIQVYTLLMAPTRPPSIRGEAVRGLVNISAPNAASAALAALKSDDSYLQVVGAQVIGSMNDPKIVARAVNEWPQLAQAPQVALLTVLADRRDPAVAHIAISALDSKVPAVRTAGIRAAGQVGAADAVPRLLDIMLHGEGSDRGVARDALAGLPGAAAEKEILDQVRQGNPEVRAALMGVLVDRPTSPAVAALLEVARGTDGQAASEAIRALGRVGAMKEYGELVQILTSTEKEEVRDASKDAVVSIAQRMEDKGRTSEPVLTAYGSAAGPAKAALLAVLGETGGDRALDELKRAATSEDPDLKQAAVRALAETWSDARPLPTLLTIATTDPAKPLRVQALRGYIRIVGQTDSMPAQERVTRIGDAIKAAERPEEKRQALSILRDVRTPGSVELAAQQLSDPAVFGDAADTVIYLAGQRRKNNRDLAAVTGPATTAALDKIIQMTKDDVQREAAQKLK